MRPLWKKYRKKEIIVEAIQYTGDNHEEVNEFAWQNLSKSIDNKLIIPTLEGDMFASPGDYIIRGIHAELYPIKEQLFFKTYDPIESN